MAEATSASSGPKMERVNSSNMHSMGFHEGSLYIRFLNGNAYKYSGPNVPKYWEGIQAADSKGSYFLKNIKNCKETTFEKVALPPSE